MSEFSTIVGCLTWIALVSDVSPVPEVRDMGLLQGSWAVVTARIAGKEHNLDGSKNRMTISGNRLEDDFLFTLGAKFAIDASTSPKVMRYVATTLGRPVEQSMTYEVTRDRLKLGWKDGSYFLFKRELKEP